MGEGNETAADRQRAAFAAVLAEDPNTPPGPAALNRRLGRHSHNGINWSKLRTQLLLEAGFTKNSRTGRWGKP